MLNVDDGIRDRLAMSAVRDAVGRNSHVAAPVARVVMANADRFGLSARLLMLARLDRGISMLGDPYRDAPVWRRTADRLRRRGTCHTVGLDGSVEDLQTFMFCAFRHDMRVDARARMWMRLLDDRTVLDEGWRSACVRLLETTTVDRGWRRVRGKLATRPIARP